MCTAFRMKTKDCYFGRNLDLDRSYGEEVCIMPRNFPLAFRKMECIPKHYAIIGMATVAHGVPLFYDGVNEYGLAMAGLNFPDNAYYASMKEGKDNVTPFEFIPWVLGQCKTLAEAKAIIERINLVDIAFSDKLPLSPLHWMISDAAGSVVFEQRRDGVHIHDNSVGVMANNPPFEYQLENLAKYRHLRIDNKNVVREDNPDYTAYSQGLGGVGLPGDVSSMSRFVRGVFHLENVICGDDELSSVGQFFHLLSSVEMVRGACKTDDGTWDITGYSACINCDKRLYYYTTYDNRQITCVDMYKTDLEASAVSRFPLKLG